MHKVYSCLYFFSRKQVWVKHLVFADYNNEFTAYLFRILFKSCQDLLYGASQELFIYVRRFPGNDHATCLVEKFGQAFKSLQNAMGRFVKNDGARRCGNLFEKCLSSLFVRQEAKKREFGRHFPRCR